MHKMIERHENGVINKITSPKGDVICYQVVPVKDGKLLYGGDHVLNVPTLTEARNNLGLCAMLGNGKEMNVATSRAKKALKSQVDRELRRKMRGRG